MKTPKYISHLRKYDEFSDKWMFQSNEEHSKGVAKLTAAFAQKVGFEDWGVVMGLLHDKGKEQEGFQRYIRKVSGFMPEIKNAERTPHAYVAKRWLCAVAILSFARLARRKVYIAYFCVRGRTCTVFLFSFVRKGIARWRRLRGRLRLRLRKAL